MECRGRELPNVALNSNSATADDRTRTPRILASAHGRRKAAYAANQRHGEDY